VAEAKRHGWPLACAAHSTSHGYAGQQATSRGGALQIPDKLLTSYVSIPTLHVTHTLAHTYQYPSSPWASTLDHYEASELRCRVRWISASNIR